MSARHIILPFISILLFLTVLVSVFGLSSFSLLEAESYTPYFDEYGVYSYIESLVPAQARAVFSNDTSIKSIADTAIQKAFDYINGDAETLNLVLTANSSEVRETVRQRLMDVPVCDEGVDPMRDRVICRPYNVSIDSLVDQILSSEEIQTQSIDLGMYLDANGGLSQVRESVAVYRKAVYISIIASLVLILAILIIGWPLRSRGLLHAGIPILAAGLVLLSLFYFGNSFIENSIQNHLPNFTNFSLGAMTLDVVHGLYSKFIANAIIACVIGLICIVCAFLFARKE